MKQLTTHGIPKIKKWVPITAAITNILLVSALLFWRGTGTIQVFGTEINRYTPFLNLVDSEITGFNDLSELLEYFPFLLRVDLGSYPLTCTELHQLQDAHPKARFHCETFVNLFGKSYATTLQTLDFSDVRLSQSQVLKKDLALFPQLQSVVLGENTIPLQERTDLQFLYPSVDFDAVATINLCGTAFPETAEDIRLRVTQLNGTELLENLRYFPNLKRISCHTAAIPLEECKQISETYPNVEVSIAGTFEMYGKEFRDDTRYIDLTDVTLDSHLIENLHTFVHPDKVDLHGQELTLEQKTALAEAYPNTVFGWKIVVAGVEADSFENELILDKHKITDLNEVNDSLIYLPQLKTLSMCDCGLSNEVMADFRSQHPNLEVIWRVYLGKWTLKTNAVAFSVQIFKYDYRRMTSKDIEVLKYCPNLQALDIGHQAITDLSVIGDYLPNLRILILADNSVCDLTPLSKLEHLHYLELFVNRVTDLTPLASCKELVDLNISYNYGLRDVTALMNLPMLERLWLEHTSISNASFKQLRETYPDTKVVSYGTGSVDQGWRTHERYYAMQDSYHHDYLSDSFAKYG